MKLILILLVGLYLTGCVAPMTDKEAKDTREWYEKNHKDNFGP